MNLLRVPLNKLCAQCTAVQEFLNTLLERRQQILHSQPSRRDDIRYDATNVESFDTENSAGRNCRLGWTVNRRSSRRVRLIVRNFDSCSHYLFYAPRCQNPFRESYENQANVNRVVSFIKKQFIKRIRVEKRREVWRCVLRFLHFAERRARETS